MAHIGVALQQMTCWKCESAPLYCRSKFSTSSPVPAVAAAAVASHSKSRSTSTAAAAAHGTRSRCGSKGQAAPN
eukprot:1591340-Prymnesium_polylepis.4